MILRRFEMQIILQLLSSTKWTRNRCYFEVCLWRTEIYGCVELVVCVVSWSGIKNGNFMASLSCEENDAYFFSTYNFCSWKLSISFLGAHWNHKSFSRGSLNPLHLKIFYRWTVCNLMFSWERSAFFDSDSIWVVWQW